MTDNYLKTVFTKWFNSNKKEFIYFGKKDKVVWISRNKFIRKSNLGYEINTYIKEWEKLFRNTPEGYVGLLSNGILFKGISGDIRNFINKINSIKNEYKHSN